MCVCVAVVMGRIGFDPARFSRLGWVDGRATILAAGQVDADQKKKERIDGCGQEWISI